MLLKAALVGDCSLADNDATDVADADARSAHLDERSQQVLALWAEASAEQIWDLLRQLQELARESEAQSPATEAARGALRQAEESWESALSWLRRAIRELCRWQWFLPTGPQYMIACTRRKQAA